MTKTVIGIFGDRQRADQAIDELERQGFANQDISVIVRENTARGQTGGATIVEGVASGATTGGVIGGVAGLLVGIGAVTIPGIGALLIGGPIAAALGLTGAAAVTVSGAVTGALAGGLVGALVSLGVPEEEAKVYESRIREGAVLVAVPVKDKDDEVRAILEKHGAEKIRSVVHP